MTGNSDVPPARSGNKEATASAPTDKAVEAAIEDCAKLVEEWPPFIRQQGVSEAEYKINLAAAQTIARRMRKLDPAAYAIDRGPSAQGDGDMCPTCIGTGTVADYVGDTMSPVEVECYRCNGSGKVNPPTPAPSATEQKPVPADIAGMVEEMRAGYFPDVADALERLSRENAAQASEIERLVTLLKQEFTVSQNLQAELTRLRAPANVSEGELREILALEYERNDFPEQAARVRAKDMGVVELVIIPAMRSLQERGRG